MQADLQRELVQLGFTERQACVYVTLLQFGKCGVQQLALAAGLPRASCYDTLQQLIAQGLARLHNEDGQQFFVTEPPDRIVTMLALQLEQIKARQRRAETFLPQLSALMDDGHAKPRVRLVSDTQELSALHAGLAKLNQPILQLIGYDTFVKRHEQIAPDIKLRGRVILVTDRVVTRPTGSQIELRCLPTALFDLQGEMMVCGDHVIHSVYGESVLAVEIISSVIAQTSGVVLELAWQRAGELERQLKGET